MALRALTGTNLRKVIGVDDKTVFEGATVAVRYKSDNSLATLYTDKAGTTSSLNPFLADSSGTFLVWTQPDTYEVTVTSGTFVGTSIFDLAEVRSQKTTDIAVHDGMYSWWTKPNVIRYTDEDRDWTVQSFTTSSGAVGVIIHNHLDRNTRRYILDDSGRNPDDHNAGCITIGDGKVVAVYGGRSNNTGVAATNECLVCEWNIWQEPNPANITKYYLAVGRDYPVMFQYDDDAILMVSQRGGPIPAGDPSFEKPSNTPPNTWTTGHAFMTNSWPLGTGAASWSAKTPLTNYIIDDPNIMPAWMYTTSRRNADDPSIIDMIWGFHPNPVNQPLANIYKSQVRHVGGANPWRFYVNGVEVANLSTGVGLPIELADLELAYTAAVGEKTRLYDVKGDSFVFTTYTTDATVSTYRYGYKSGGVWYDSHVAHCGDPFYKGQSFYFGGASISENADIITVAQNNLNTVDIIAPDATTSSVDVNGDWKFVDLRSNDSGVTWNELQSYSIADDNKGGLIHGRPQAEHASLYNIETDSTAVYQTMGWVGQYSINSFNDFASSIISLAPRPKWFTPQSYEFNGSVIASADNASDGDKQAFVGSESCILNERERQVVAACSDVEINTRNSFAGGARRVNFTGTGDASGTTDTWLMGVVGANESTIGKNYSFIGGGNDITLGVADSEFNRCNAAIAAESCSADGGSSFVSFTASKDCGDNDGDYSFYAASTNCNVIQDSPSNTGRSAFIASLGDGVTNGINTKSRTYQIGSNSCIASGLGAGVLSSTGDSLVTGDNSVIVSSDSSTNNADNSAIVASLNCENEATNTLLVASRDTIIPATTTSEPTGGPYENVPYSIAGGYGTGGALSANRTWHIFSQTGNAFLKGTLTQGHGFADIAKMIKNGEGSEIEAGYLLTIIGDKVYKAQDGESVGGIVAATPSSIHNDTPFHWQGRNLIDDFGRELKEPKEFVRWGELEEIHSLEKQYPASANISIKTIDGLDVSIACLPGYDGLVENAPEVPSWAEYYTMQVPVENPAYDPTVSNIKRSDRPDEWTVCGINGFIRTRIDETVTQAVVDNAAISREKVYIKPINGKGSLSEIKTNVQVMKVEKEFNGAYGVAVCFLK